MGGSGRVVQRESICESRQESAPVTAARASHKQTCLRREP